jgi:hypothetical protein
MPTNSFHIQYYQISDTNNILENEVRLIRIIDSNSQAYDSLSVRNVLGKKSLVVQS